MKGLILTYLLTYGGAVASLFDPFLGLLIYVSFAIIKPEAMWPWSVPPGNYSRVVALALLAGWVRVGFGKGELGRARGVAAALVGLWIWAGLGAVQAADARIAWGFVESLGKIVLPFVVGLTIINSVRQVKQLVWVIVLSQGYVAFELNLSYLQGYNRVREEGFAGLDNNCVAIALVTATGLTFFLGLHARAWWHKILAYAAVALMVHGVLLTFSRGGMLALIIMSLVAFWLIPKRPGYYIIFALLILLGLRFTGPEVRQRFATIFSSADERDSSAQGRLDLWINCWDAMLKRPVFGIGPDHFPLIAQEYGWPAGKEAHSLWMQTGAELGFPGLGFLALFYVLTVSRLWPMTREFSPCPEPWFRGSARMVIASLTGFVVSAQFVSIEGLELPYYVALIGASTLKLVSASLGAPAGARR